MATVNQHTDIWNTAGVAALPGHVSEEQFVAWAQANPSVRAEWTEGETVVMSPAGRDHNSLQIWLSYLLLTYLDHRPIGEILGPEFMVRLLGGRSRRNPDLLFVAKSNSHLVRETYFDGSPDLVVEIVSADSQSRDYREKYLEYEAAGVREFWIVDPLSHRIEAYRLGDDGRFVLIDEADGKIASSVLDGFYLRNEWPWATPRPTALSLLKEMGIV